MPSGIRSDAVTLAAVAGAMLGVVCRGTSYGLIAAPAWILLACAILIGTALAMAKPRPRILLALSLGLAMSFAIRSGISPPSAGVLTHGVAFAHGVDLFAALQQLDDDPQRICGTRISVSGLWRPQHGRAAAAVYRTVMACCIADAIDVGFDVSPVFPITLAPGAPVRVSGIVEAVDADGEIRYRLAHATVTRL